MAPGDGLRLRDAYVAAAVRCAPPANKPTLEERDTCLPYLVRELALLDRLRVLVVLGSFAYEATARVLAALGTPLPPPAAAVRPRRRGAVGEARLVVVCAFHPSQQNTFTGKLTPPMLDDVFHRTRELAG